MLQEVAGVLQRPDVVDRLMAATSADEVYAILDSPE
jgi:mannitol/fructose-specific phosphotransferase system IIA component (Ntr-type)